MTTRRRLAGCFTCLAVLVGWIEPLPAQELPPPRVDTLWTTVHGHRIAFFVSGDPAAPAVVLEPGGGSHAVWGDLPAAVARFAKVVTYDRPGYGLSDSCSSPRSASVIATELYEALTAIQIAPPYTMVGWSLGGSFVRVFAGTYPGLAAGLVLIDPAPEAFYERAARERADVWNPMLAEQNRRMASRPQGDRAEWAAWQTTMTEARHSDRDLKAEVVLLTATMADDELQPIWIEEHRRWAGRMPNVRHILVEGAGHAIFRDRPSAVIRAIQDQLAATRR
jgi:pimeloyl-ACP methyl ester carboxylesterase